MTFQELAIYGSTTTAPAERRRHKAALRKLKKGLVWRGLRSVALRSKAIRAAKAEAGPARGGAPPPTHPPPPSRKVGNPPKNCLFPRSRNCGRMKKRYVAGGGNEMYNLNWSRSDLTRQKLGTFCEYYAKMSLASYGVSIYTSEVDDHGIDFIAESKRGFLKFQVKAIRKGTGYVFMREEYFDISDQSLYLFLLLLNDGEHPIEYLIPATTWDNDSSNIFVYHSYKGKKVETRIWPKYFRQEHSAARKI